jgi:hypothetical protein
MQVVQIHHHLEQQGSPVEEKQAQGLVHHHVENGLKLIVMAQGRTALGLTAGL